MLVHSSRWPLLVTADPCRSQLLRPTTAQCTQLANSAGRCLVMVMMHVNLPGGTLNDKPIASPWLM